MTFPHLFGLDALGVSLGATSPEPQPGAISGRLAMPWATTVAVSGRAELMWANTQVVCRTIAFPWSEKLAGWMRLEWASRVSRRMAFPWGKTTPVAKRLVAPWALTSPLQGGVVFPWDISSRHRAAASCRLPWTAPADGQVIDSSVVLLAGDGRWLSPRRVTVSASENSPYWQADITLGGEEEFLQLETGEQLTLTMCGYTFSLRLDERGENAQGPAGRTWSAKALSPVAWLDTPYALSGDISFLAGTTAKEAVESLLGGVVTLAWSLPDWTLPTAGLAFTSATPLAAARSIVEAIGGLLESRPDGSVVARRRYRVAPADFTSAVPDVNLYDSEATVRSTSTINVEIVNRLTIGNGGASDSSSDRIEFEADTNPLSGTVRAWPSPWRPVSLVHTGRPSVSITPKGIRVWEIEETVEFKDGAARLSTPAQALLEVTWLHTDLGGVLLDGDTLTASYGLGYSLAKVRYSTRAYVWAVADDQVEEVQFLLEDADE